MYEGILKELVQEFFSSFQKHPHDFFNEKEVHCLFWEKAKDAFGSASLKDGGKPIRLLRHEYETVWRYLRKGPKSFETRLANEGSTAAFDFAVLKKAFVEEHDRLTVVNKNEPFRRILRDQDSIFDLVIEFKMAHHRNQGRVSPSQESAYRKGMVLDARKCAHENPDLAAIIGLSHGPGPDKEGMVLSSQLAKTEYLRINPNGKILIFQANPKFSFGDF